jgi:hypothetical protein
MGRGLHPAERCIASVGLNPRPFRTAYFRAKAPVDAAIKACGDCWYEASTRARGEPVVPLRVRDAFHAFDEDGNGHIDSDELKLALEALGFSLTLDASVAVLAKYDDDEQNGTLELEEFYELVRDFERIAPVALENATSSSKDADGAHLTGARAERRKQMERDCTVAEVRRLSLFLEQGITGLTPRDEDALDKQRGQDQESAKLVGFLKELGVTLKAK